MSDGASSGRTPPHDEAAERALLGALLLDPDRIAEAAENLQPDDFWLRRHALLFETIRQLTDEDVPVDAVSVGATLRSSGRLHEVGGLEYLAELVESVTSSAHTAHHARLVGDSAVLRRLVREATEMVTEAFDTPLEPKAVEELVDRCEGRLFTVSRDERAEGMRSVGEAIQGAFLRLTQRGKSTQALETGFYDLDDKLCGLNKGDLLVVAGRPSMGKTAFVLNVVDHVSLSRPEWMDRRPTCLLFSLEMGAEQLVQRLLCTRGRVEGHRLRSGKLGQEEFDKLTEAAGELEHAKLFIDDSPDLTLMSLRTRARRLKKQENLDLVVVDYLQLVSSPRSENRLQEISSISRGLKALARELEIPVIALAQLSRQVEGRDDKRPLLADLRESGSIEQDADVVMLLFRKEYYTQYQDDENAKNRAEVIIAKHRNGPTGTVELAFFNQYMRFDNPSFQAVEVFAT